MRKGLSLGVLGFLWMVVGRAAARGGMPEPVTESGQRMESIYFQIFVAGTLVFLLVFGLLVFVLWRYRESTGKGRTTFEHERGSVAAELSWTLIPLLIVGWVGWIAYEGLLELDGDSIDGPADLTIDIVGSQWNWMATYPGGILVSASPSGTDGEVAPENAFVVPADKAIRFNITSVDVIHSFYIHDHRYGPVGMVDANPNGPNKYNQLVARFPEGDYFVQCKEMCMNPGHAYMRARIKSVPQADYDAWLERKTLEASCPHPVVQFQDLTASAAGISRPTPTAAQQPLPIVAVRGSCIVWSVANGATTAANVSASGAATGSVVVDAGASEFWLLGLAEAGEVSVTSDLGGFVNFSVIVAEARPITLDEYSIGPAQIMLEAGTTYLFQVENAGAITHNIFIGRDGEAVAASPDIAGFASGSFVWTPTQTGMYDTWCNIPGHRSAGMEGTLDVHA